MLYLSSVSWGPNFILVYYLPLWTKPNTSGQSWRHFSVCPLRVPRNNLAGRCFKNYFSYTVPQPALSLSCPGHIVNVLSWFQASVFLFTLGWYYSAVPWLAFSPLQTAPPFGNFGMYYQYCWFYLLPRWVLGFCQS